MHSILISFQVTTIQVKRNTSGRKSEEPQDLRASRWRENIGGMRLRHDTEATKADKQYTEAHAAHYKSKDLNKALKLYKEIMATHPNTEEAKYSRVQIQNIVIAVVPKQKLFDVQVDLAVAQLDHD